MSLEDVREESCSTPPEGWKATEGYENDEKGGEHSTTMNLANFFVSQYCNIPFHKSG